MGEIAIFVPGCLCAAGALLWRGDLCAAFLQSAIVSKETEESVSVHLMKAIADNPHDERLLSEIGAYREVFFSELWGKAAC